jgi:hypothetical protein
MKLTLSRRILKFNHTLYHGRVGSNDKKNLLKHITVFEMKILFVYIYM